MAMNMKVSRRTKIYAKAAVSDLYTMYFQHVMKENDDTQFLKEPHKEFYDLISKGIFEMIPNSIVPEGETIFPAVRAMNQKWRLLPREIYKYKA